jgi:hypothetical protein
VINNADATLSMCAGGLLDTGNPEAQIELSDPSTPTTRWTPRTQVNVTIGPSTQPLSQYTYVISQSPLVGIDATETDGVATAGDPALINLGISVFFNYDAMFDDVNGIVGLRAK